MTYRDPEEPGLVTIYHPRGNGTDNSPQWDAVLENVEVGELGAYPCYDLQHVTDPSHCPTYAEYDRYLWLVNLIKRAGCDEASIYETHPFLVKDVLASAILVVANEALLEIGELVEAGRKTAPLSRGGWRAAGEESSGAKDPEFGLCQDYDLRADRALRHRSTHNSHDRQERALLGDAAGGGRVSGSGSRLWGRRTDRHRGSRLAGASMGDLRSLEGRE
jgi:hypothetical protein